MVRSEILVPHQPGYLPWIGYFARLLDAPELLILDHVQYEVRGFQNRNRIAGSPPNPWQWLTVPVRTRHRFGQPISDVQLADEDWQRKHWATLSQVYGRAPHFRSYSRELKSLLLQEWSSLVELDIATTRWLMGELGINIPITRSSSLELTGSGTRMLVELCKMMGRTVLRTGTGALSYLDRGVLEDGGIRHEVFEFRHPQYDRETSPFISNLSAVDMLFFTGGTASDLLVESATSSGSSMAD